MHIAIHAALYFLYLATFLCLIYRGKFFDLEGTNKKHFAFFFLLKVVAGVFLTLIYTYYYTDRAKADIYRFFNDSKIISPLLFSQPVAWLKIMTGYGINEPEVFKHLLPTQYFSHPGLDIVTNNTFIIRVNVLLNYFSFSNIYINTLFLNFISFIGLTALFKVLRPYFSSFQQILYVPLFLLPSVVFWSSGLLKESLLFTGLAMFLQVYLCQPFESLRQLFLTGMVSIAGLFILILTKLPVAVVALVISGIVLQIRKPSVYARTIALFLLVIVIASVYWYGNYVCSLLLDKRNEFIELALQENAGSILDTHMIESIPVSLLKLLPVALTEAVFRPFVWSSGKIFEKAFAFENLLFLLLCILPLRWFKIPTGERLMLSLCFLLFAFCNYLVIGITVPITGAIVHYRVIAAPFLLLAVLLCVDLKKLKQAAGL